MTRPRPPAPQRIVLLLSVALATTGLPLDAAAQAAAGAASVGEPGGPAWSSLTPAQQSALAPLRRDWPGIDAMRKQKWLEIAARFPWIPPDERERMQERMAEWSRMTPDERARARLQFQEARQISPQQRQSRWDAYMALPPEERRALAKSAGTVPRTAPPPASLGAPVGAVGQRSAAAKAPPKPIELKPVAPTLVQVKPGVSTTLISNTAKPPPHAKPGDPKVVGPGVVNGSTLLPRAGPQGAAVLPPQASTGSAPQR